MGLVWKQANSRIGLAILFSIVFVAILFVPPAHPKFDSWFGRIFMGVWTAGGLSLAAIFLVNLLTARLILDSLFVWTWSTRDAYALSDLELRAYGLLELGVVVWGLYAYVNG